MKISKFIGVILLGMMSAYTMAAQPLCASDTCCGGRAGGISYCDSSAGRYVCHNGDYSVCYCTRHAVMDLQALKGCCLWHGGVLDVDRTGLVICQDGGVSEECTLQTPKEKIVSW